MRMSSLHVVLLSFTAMAFIGGLYGSSCDESCGDKPVFSPPRLVVEYGRAASFRCTACQKACQPDQTGMDVSVGQPKKDGNMMLWKTNELLDWDLSATCYNTDDNGARCCSHLPVTVYKPPSFVLLDLTETVDRVTRYTLDCTVAEVVPLENVAVTFYKEVNGFVEEIAHRNSRRSSRSPDTETFTLELADFKDDDTLYWCETQLNLGPQGPRPPTVHSNKTGSRFRLIQASSNGLTVSLGLCCMLLVFSLAFSVI